MKDSRPRPYWQEIADLGGIFLLGGPQPLIACSHHEQARFRGAGSERFRTAVGSSTC